MNLTTVRTHQYAVWITIGFFEVKRQGDLRMIRRATRCLAFDLLGPRSAPRPARRRGSAASSWSTGSSSPASTHTTPAASRPAVVYRQMIE